MESFLTSAGYAALILFGFLEAASTPAKPNVISDEIGMHAASRKPNKISARYTCDARKLSMA